MGPNSPSTPPLSRRSPGPATHTRVLTRCPDGPLTVPPGASEGALKWPCARGEHAAGSARGTVVPESVEPATTAARAGGEWQGQAQAPQEQNAELRIRNGHGLVRGRDCAGSGRVWPSLRQQQRTGRKGEVRKMRHARALVARSGSLALPSLAARLRRQGGKPTPARRSRWREGHRVPDSQRPPRARAHGPARRGAAGLQLPALGLG